MAETDIITGQYVRITQTAASLGDRIVACAIDVGIVSAYAIVMGYVIDPLFQLQFDVFTPIFRLAVFLLLFFVPITFYSLFCETFFRGQTIGKHLRHLRVVSIDGSQPTIGQLTIRWMFLLVDLLMGAIGAIPIAMSKRHQRFGDMAAGTIVIHEDDYQKWHSALDDFYWLTPTYKPTYPQVQRLSDGQANLIDRTLHGKSDYDFEQITKLADKVAHYLNVKPKEDKLGFLTKILHDYQYYTLDPV